MRRLQRRTPARASCWAKVDEELKARHAEPLLRGHHRLVRRSDTTRRRPAQRHRLLDRGNPPRLHHRSAVSAGALQTVNVCYWHKADELNDTTRHQLLTQFGPCTTSLCSPDPPNSAGKSFSFGSPSRIGSTV